MKKRTLVDWLLFGLACIAVSLEIPWGHTYLLANKPRR